MSRFLLFWTISLATIGCGANQMARESPRSDARKSADEQHDGAKSMSASTSAKAGAELPPIAGTPQATRKIIYKSRLEFAVEDFSGVPERVAELANTYGGFIADSEVQGQTGRPRHGEWTLRVPVERLEDALKASRSLGEIIRQSTESDEVTEEFYDLDARIRAKKAEETRVLKHLEVDTKELEQILAVERELSRIRSEIESMEGRLRLLDNLTSLATIVITVREIKDYVPPEPESPSFGDRIARTFDKSLGNVGAACQDMAVGIVGAAPWLAVWSPAILFSGWVLWRWRRRIRKTPAMQTVEN